MKLAELLKEKRILAGKTQGEVSKECGYTTSQFVSNWERGISNPPPAQLNTVGRVYNLEPLTILEMLETEAAEEAKAKLRAKYEEATAV